MKLNRPLPCPLPQERENRQQSVGEKNALETFTSWAWLFPLSEGEGQGERHSWFNPALSTRNFHGC